jgi:hypothetical protein
MTVIIIVTLMFVMLATHVARKAFLKRHKANLNLKRELHRHG